MEPICIQELVDKIKNSENVKQNMLLLYNENKNFLFYMASVLKVSAESLDDFMQLGYLALVQAVRTYNRMYSFSYYYSLYIRHEYYEYHLRMHFPVRVSHSFYKNNLDKSPLLTASVSLDYCTGASFHEDSFEESSLVRIEVWTVVRDCVTELNYYIVQQRYINQRTFEDIGNELGIGKDRVRKRLVRCLAKLHDNKRLQEIALDYFNIH